MRKLLLLRGIPGCGKSTFIREQNLEPYTLSPDTLRLAFAGPTYNARGQVGIPQENDRAVWQLLFELLEKRMFRGELVIVDATHSHPRSFNNYKQLARKHRYQVLCVDFSDVPLAVCQERNTAREPYKLVPPLEMERMHENMQRSVIPEWITVVRPEAIADVLTVQPKDVSHYKQVHHIGDIQGCYDPLMTYFADGIKDDELYIFTGDYLDRGTQNAAVMEWLLEHYQRPNFVFIEGNHEAHLRQWVAGAKARSREFEGATKPQLEGAGLAPKKVHGFMYQLREVFYYTFHGRTVIVTHGGLSCLPDRLTTVPARQLTHGMGLYEEADVADASFAASVPAETYQIHGHRNRNESPLRVNEHCFNLEGKVEFAGELRTVTLTPEGFVERPITSTIDASSSLIEPMVGVSGPGSMMHSVADMVTQLRASNTIYEKPQEGTNISSFNFKRDVFFQKAWDNLNVHARGLFINTAQETIVARAYEKFFNIGERPETQPDVLRTELQFPVRAWVKENGYLGMVGYDSEQGQLIYASKSSLTSDFAQWLRTQFEQLLATSGAREAIELYLQEDGGRTLVFEVIDPQNDPHIVPYQSPQLVLLDVVKNMVHFTTESEAERTRIATLLGCTVKRLGATLANADEFEAWLRQVKDFDYTFAGEPIEGFVLEDASGFMVKLKLPWYAFWRQMRTQLEKLQQGKKAQLPSLDINNELAQAFLTFLATKDTDGLKGSTLVTLRHEFEALGAAATAHETQTQ